MNAEVNFTTFLSNREAATFTGFSSSTLNNSRYTGLLGGVKAPPYLKLGKSIRYRKEDLEVWLAQFQTQTNTSENVAQGLANMKKATSKRSSPKKRQQNNKQKNQLGKLESMLLRFAAGKKYHRFSAELVGDHALPSTISSLQKMYDIHFSRKWITVPNRFDSESHVKLYWLEGRNLAHVKDAVRIKEAP